MPLSLVHSIIPVLLIASLPAVEVDLGVPLPATVLGFSLQFNRSPNNDQGSLNLQLATRIPDGQLLGWRQARVLAAVGLDGMSLGTATIDENSAPRPNSNDNQDDLNHLLSLSFNNLSRPPNGLKILRLAAVAIIASPERKRLVLPVTKVNTSYAPADQPDATVTCLRIQGNQLFFALSEGLLDRTVRVSGRGPAGELSCNVYLNSRRGNGGELVVNPQNGEAENFQPVFELADRIERRAVILTLENQDFYSDTAQETTLIPLQKLSDDPAIEVSPIAVTLDPPHPVVIPMPPKRP